MIDTTSNPCGFGKVGRDIPRPLNAVGYHLSDRSLYGYRMIGKPGIVRVNPTTGRARYLGVPRGLPKDNYISGDVAPNTDTYYLYAAKSGVLRVVDLSSFRTMSVKLSSRVNLADLAASPNNGRLYGVEKSGRLLEIGPQTGGVVPKSVPALAPGIYGAAWFTSDGDLIVYENGKADTNGTLYQISDPTGTSEVVSRDAGQSAFGNDGAAYVAPPNPAGLSVEVDVLANDDDTDGKIDPGTIKITEDPSNGVARVNPKGTITYTSGAGYTGTDAFRYEVCDDGPNPRCGGSTANTTAQPILNPPGGLSTDRFSAREE